MNKQKAKQIAAILALILILCIFISLILCLIRGSSPSVILAHLFCIMIIPCMIYAFRLILNAAKRRKEQNADGTKKADP